MGNNDSPFAAGAGPTLEYDFYVFNTLANNVLNATVYLSPALNSYGRPLAFGAALDAQAATNVSFVPDSKPGTLPAAWKTLDGWVAVRVHLTTGLFILS